MKWKRVRVGLDEAKTGEKVHAKTCGPLFRVDYLPCEGAE